MSTQFIKLSFFLLCLPFSLGAQNSYVTPHGQFIKINNESWEYVDSMSIPKIDNNVSTEFSKKYKPVYDSLMVKLLMDEADFFAGYIIFSFMQANDDSGSTTRSQSKQLLSKCKSIGKLIEDLQNIPSIEPEKIPATFDKIDSTYHKITIEETSGSKEILSQTLSKPKLEIDTIANHLDSLSEIIPTEYIFEPDPINETTRIRNNNCQLVFNGYDENLELRRTETAPIIAFEYTHPKLIRHFKDKSFLVGETSIIKLEEDYLLQLKITVKSKDARRSYGSIEKNAMLRISYLSGKKTFLRNGTLSEGNLESYTGNTVYNCFYSLHKDIVEDLRVNNIDKIGIMWTTGFEDYTIYQIDIFKNQIHCLENGHKN